MRKFATLGSLKPKWKCLSAGIRQQLSGLRWVDKFSPYNRSVNISLRNPKKRDGKRR